MVDSAKLASQYESEVAQLSQELAALRRPVSARVPHGGPLAGGTRVVVLGAGFAAFATGHLKCRFGTEVVAAELVNETALVCTSLARGGASLEAVEVTLNADVSSHSLTADGVVFDYYDASAVAIAGRYLTQDQYARFRRDRRVLFAYTRTTCSRALGNDMINCFELDFQPQTPKTD